jgi:hypothetical protein
MTHTFQLLAESLPAWLSAGRLLTAASLTFHVCVRRWIRPSPGRMSDAWRHDYQIAASKHQDE